MRINYISLSHTGASLPLALFDPAQAEAFRLLRAMFYLHLQCQADQAAAARTTVVAPQRQDCACDGVYVL